MTVRRHRAEQQAAIDHIVGPGDECGLVGAEKQHEACNLVRFGQALHGLGYDYLHLSSGGNVPRALIPGDQPGYQVRFAEAVKQAAPQASVMAVGTT